ncbi:hypothetical protein D3C73_1025430 [compost metagenome]
MYRNGNNIPVNRVEIFNFCSIIVSISNIVNKITFRNSHSYFPGEEQIARNSRPHFIWIVKISFRNDFILGQLADRLPHLNPLRRIHGHVLRFIIINLKLQTSDIVILHIPERIIAFVSIEGETVDSIFTFSLCYKTCFIKNIIPSHIVCWRLYPCISEYFLVVIQR